MKLTKMKKILAVALIGAMVTTCFAGCGEKGKKSGNSKSDIEINYWNAGLGTDWLEAIIAAFEKEHPEYNVTYTATADAASTVAPFGIEDTDTIDLYLALKLYDFDHMEPLDDVLNATVEGESKTIGEKFDSSYLQFEKAQDGKCYTLTYGGGISGIVYNKKMFKDAGIKELPRTTDELASVCDTFYSKGIAPFCHFKPSGYWSYLTEAWFAQYDGLDYYLNTFYACKDETGKSPSKEVFKTKDGRYEALKAYEKFLTPDYVLAGSNSSEHVTMQTKFISGEAAMMANGSWLANEMASAGSTKNFEMMHMPVISSITDKLSTVKKESELRKVISAIDAVVSGEKEVSAYQSGDGYDVDGISVSADDWNYIKTARYTMPANFAEESAFIPSYSNAKEGAKEFLKFLYSDKGIKIYTDTLNMIMPINLSEGELDISKWSDFEKNQYELYKSTEQFVTYAISSKHNIFTDGGAYSFASYEYINRLCTNNATDRQSAKEIWAALLKKIDTDYENNWLQNIK